MSRPKIGELFAGYGGLGMGVQQVIDADVAWFSEFDAAPSKILAHHWPDIPNHGDITKIDWSTVEPVDILTGGYPCPPFSTIGKRKGKNDDRYLWPHFATAIRELRPRLAILENVAGHLSLGFDGVLGSLAEIGYDAAWVCIPASAAGAPHKRERVFVVAYPESEPWRFIDGDCLHSRGEALEPRSYAGPGGACRVADVFWGDRLQAIRHWESVLGRNAPWPGFVGGGVSTRFTEWEMGLPDGHVTEPAIGLSREQQAHALGNGVVPQQAALAVGYLLSQVSPSRIGLPGKTDERTNE